MNCKTCKHWFIDPDEYYNTGFWPYKNEENYDTFETETEIIKHIGYTVRQCKKARFYEFPGINECAVLDGSNYYGRLFTGENFGCPQWEG